MKAVIFSLQTQQPLLATSFQGDPNSDVSFSYIPGSMIRGALIGRYMKQEGLHDLNLDDAKIQQLFFDPDQIRYLNAYLEDSTGRRTLPTPKSWFKEKNTDLPPEDSPGMSVYDRIHPDCELPDIEEFEPKKVTQEFCTVKDSKIILHAVTRRLNVHNQRDRRKGRSMQARRDQQTNEQKGEGTIFRYDAIDTGQTFQAVILCQSDEAATILQQLLERSNDLWLGGSQSAGYGHTKILNPHPDNQDWSEIGIKATKRAKQNICTITLLSDALLRDEFGQPTADIKLIRGELESLLKRTLPDLKISNIYSSNIVVGGFNRKWGLPLPQVIAVSAGSVISFKGLELSADEIQQLETYGIGDRRIDGFGRVAVNWIEEWELSAKRPEPSKQTQTLSLETELSRTIARRMAKQLMKQRLERQLEDRVSRLSIQGEGIKNSQLSRLQLIAREALTTGNCDSVRSLLANLPSNASGQFERAKIDGISLRQNLDEWLNHPVQFVTSWFTRPERDLTLTVGDESVQQSLTEELAKEYTLRLIIAIAKKTVKERAL
ncbi:RAMP superfamily CRISPR-associated protein [Pantanalinema rosaneae CENA516]|uniref:RAMP superfamily CRISPR-associated protein n=1 Tax=Pantanalinema rosaneae TaxID=1620701 RepID=UPI003D6F1CB6